jgi:hypothetical protein
MKIKFSGHGKNLKAYAIHRNTIRAHDRNTGLAPFFLDLRT